MTLTDQFKFIDFDTKDSLTLETPGANISLKNPDSGSPELCGWLGYVAPKMLKDISNSNFEETLPYGKYFDLMHCSWPCWLPNHGNPISTSFTSGILFLNQDSQNTWNLTNKNDIKEFIVWEQEQISKKLAGLLNVPFDSYCKKYYFPKKQDDIHQISAGNLVWHYALYGGGDLQDETTTFYLILTNKSVLELHFNIGVTESLKSHPELNNLKHKIVTDYLKHVIIEPRPMTETVPA